MKLTKYLAGTLYSES